MRRNRLGRVLSIAVTMTAFATAHPVRAQDGRGAPDGKPRIMWINHFALLPGDPSVTTSFNAISSGVGGGLTGLVVQSRSTGDTHPAGGNKVVHMALQVPPGYVIKGVRACYELSNRRSFITQIRLSQVKDPPASATVMLDDATDQTNPGPVCVNSVSTSVDPAIGAVLLDLRVNIGNTSDKIVVRALGLHLTAKP